MLNQDIEARELDTLTGAPISLTLGGRDYKLKEPTLAVLDEMSRIWLQLPSIDIKSGTRTALEQARGALPIAAKPLAKSIAIAIAGEGYFTPWGRIRARMLANKIYRTTTPKELKKAAETLTAHGGLVDFIISMASLSTARTTRPGGGIE